MRARTPRRRGCSGAAAAALAVACLAAGAPAPADQRDAGPAHATVVVDANRFAPFETAVRPGGTVTWEVREAGHTIVADDGRFDLRGPDGADLPPGARPTVTVGQDDEVVRYHCTVHGGPGGQGMSGVLVVGRPAPDVADPAVIRVPDDASLAGAVAAARPGTRIEVRPGRHVLDAPLEVDLVDEGHLPGGLTIVGTGERPGDVVVRLEPPPQRASAPAALRVTGAFVTVANLTVLADRVASSGAAIHLDGANQVALADVVVDGGGLVRDGVRISDASGGLLDGVRVHGFRRAGIRIGPCAACGITLADLEVGGGLVGVLATAARGVVVRESVVEENAVGIVASGSPDRPSTVEVVDNVVRGNVRRTGLPEATDPERRLATGAAIWLDGVVASLVRGNEVADHRFGVVLTGGAQGVRVVDNRFAGNATDLAWDGLGARTCFAGNTGVGETSPPALAALHPCSRPTVGVPWPPVHAALLLAAHD